MPIPFTADQIPSLTGKVALVTGGNGGIGLETVRQLGLHGAKVWIACRTPSKGEEAVRSLREQNPSIQVETIKIVLDDLSSVRECAKEFLAKEKQLDILVCNAGIMAAPYELTKDGIEQQFQVNHLSHFLLVKELLPLLKESGKNSGHPSRIVNLSSFAHNFINVDPFRNKPDFTSKQGVNKPLGNAVTEFLTWATYLRYSQSKLANILFAREINKREGPFVRAAAVHPGFVNSELYGTAPAPMRAIVNKFFIGTADGALSTLYAATSPEIEEKNEWNVYRGDLGKLHKQTKQSQDDKLAQQLWDLSEALIRET